MSAASIEFVKVSKRYGDVVAVDTVLFIVAGFMGDANRVRATLRRIDDVSGELAVGPLTMILPHRGLPPGAVEVAIRPEAIHIADDGRPGIAGTIRKASYIGGFMEYSIATDLGALFVINMAVDHPRRSGTRVTLTLGDHGVVPVAPT